MIDVAKLGDGLTRPSTLLLLLYGLEPVCEPIRVDNPRMLPRLRVVRRSGCRELRLRNMVPPGLKDEVDALAPKVLPKGCRICWLLIALYISWFCYIRDEHTSNMNVKNLEQILHVHLPTPIVHNGRHT